MFRPHFRLSLALTLSVIIHLSPLLSTLIPDPSPVRPPPIQAQLRPPPSAVTPEIPLELPDPPKPKPAPMPPSKPQLTTSQPSSSRTATWQDTVRQQFRQRQERGEYYPPQAIALGQQGEALVLLIIDEAGNVTAARLEESSGYPLLDDAAVRAVRSLRSLPADAPRQTLLPVRFRLR